MSGACVTLLSENTDLSPPVLHRPLCSALSADREDRGGGGVSTALTVRCSHHGYVWVHLRFHS